MKTWNCCEQVKNRTDTTNTTCVRAYVCATAKLGWKCVRAVPRRVPECRFTRTVMERIEKRWKEKVQKGEGLVALAWLGGGVCLGSFQSASWWLIEEKSTLIWVLVCWRGQGIHPVKRRVLTPSLLALTLGFDGRHISHPGAALMSIWYSAFAWKGLTAQIMRCSVSVHCCVSGRIVLFASLWNLVLTWPASGDLRG